MQLVHFYNRHNLHKFASHPDFSLFELSIWLHALARSLIGVFVPIIILTTGYSIGEVIIFYLIFNAIDVPLNFAVDRLMRKIGARLVLMLGTVALMAFFGLLGVLPPGNWGLLILLAFLAAVYDTMFWISNMYIFIEANRGGLDIGKSVGSLDAVRKLAHVMGPALGALVLVTAGKLSLVVASIAIFALSLMPLYKMRHIRDIPDEKKVSFREFFSDPREKKNYLSLAFWGVHGETEDILWPIFIFAVFGTIGSVAAVPIIVAITAAALSYLAGKLTKKYATRMIAVGSAVIACAWILRLVVDEPTIYYSTIFLVGFFSLLVAIPLDGRIVARGLQLGSLSAATYRNAVSMALRVPLYAVLALLLEVFKISFSLAAMSLFLVLLITLFFRSSGILKK